MKWLLFGCPVHLNNDNNGLNGNNNLDNNGRFVGIAKLLMLGLFIFFIWMKTITFTASFALMKILNWLSGKQEKEIKKTDKKIIDYM